MTMKQFEKIRKQIEKITFRRLLTLIMVCLVSMAFLIFSIIVTSLSERKIRENVKANMSIVVEQLDVYLGNHIANVYNGFKAFEADQSLVHLQLYSLDEQCLSYTAASYLSLKKLVDQFLNANSSCVSNVYINFNDGRVTTQAYKKDPLKISYKYSEWKKRFSEKQYYWVDADYCRDLIPDPEVGAVLFHLYEDTGSNRTGIVLIAMRKDFFENILDVASLDKDACLSLITDYGIMSFGDETAGDIVEEKRAYLEGKAAGSTKIQSEVLDDYFFIYENLDLTAWKLIYNVKEKSISNAHYILRDVMLITAVEIVVVALLLGLLSKAVSHTLMVLTKKVEAEDVLEHEISIHSYAEITSLSNSLERMRGRINVLLEQVELEQEAKHQTEIALMQEQINPHFLYNTLYACMQLCEMKQPERASKMLSALSVFYRIGLSGGSSIITVEEELRHVKNYLFIQHFRYSDVFDYTIDCDPQILKCRIPKMSLQPLVENAIYHGVKQKHELGNICILGGSSDGENAWLEVHDDGPGIPAEKIDEMRKVLDKKLLWEDKVSFGLKNVDSRIKFEFGQNSGLEIYSVPEDTCVRIRFKIKQMKKPAEKGGGA